jgi:hypothetical protein
MPCHFSLTLSAEVKLKVSSMTSFPDYGDHECCGQQLAVPSELAPQPAPQSSVLSPWPPSPLSVAREALPKLIPSPFATIEVH